MNPVLRVGRNVGIGSSEEIIGFLHSSAKDKWRDMKDYLWLSCDIELPILSTAREVSSPSSSLFLPNSVPRREKAFSDRKTQNKEFLPSFSLS